MAPIALGVLLGACLGLGLTVLYAGLRGGDGRMRLRLPVVEQLPLRLGFAVLVGGLLGLATQWPVLALAGAAGGWVLPGMALRRRAERRRMERAAALVEFVDLVADMVEGSGQGIESVLRAACQVAPRPIRPQALVLSHDLSGRLPMSRALRDFALTLSDPTSDQLVIALGLGESDQLSRVLRSVGTAGRTELQLRRRIEAGRSGLLWTGRFIVGLTVVIAVVMVLLDRTYLAPYGTVAGQVVLGVVIAILGLSLWLMGRTARISPPRRVPAARGVKP
jgi:Flp pilus assembly protein TadB